MYDISAKSIILKNLAYLIAFGLFVGCIYLFLINGGDEQLTGLLIDDKLNSKQNTINMVDSKLDNKALPIFIDVSFVDDLPKETLSEYEKQFLNTLIIDAYKARALYAKVDAMYPEKLLFRHLFMVKESQINVLEKLFQKYNLAYPSDIWQRTVVVNASLEETCNDALNNEMQGVNGYNQNFAYVDNMDLIALYKELNLSSQFCVKTLLACSQ